MLNGSKTFITNGRLADIAVVMAVTDKAKKKKGISAFIVSGGPRVPLRQEGGQARGALLRHLGARLRGLRIRPRTCWARKANGFIDTLRILDRGSIGIAAFSLGIAQASLEASHLRQGPPAVRARHRRFQAIQFKIADMATKVEASRLLTWRAGLRCGTRAGSTPRVSMAKLSPARPPSR